MTKINLSLPIGTKIIIFIFLLSGIFHLVNPGVFTALVPPVLGNEFFWIIVSGILEIACAIGLLTKQKWGTRDCALLGNKEQLLNKLLG